MFVRAGKRCMQNGDARWITTRTRRGAADDTTTMKSEGQERNGDDAERLETRD